MIGDAVSPRQRLERLSANRWECRLAMLLFALAIILALMCENVNAAPGGGSQPVDREHVSQGMTVQGSRDLPARISAVPVAAPFTIADPMCQTGFTFAQRFDQRNSAGTIIKSVWVRKCVRVPKIIYGGKI